MDYNYLGNLEEGPFQPGPIRPLVRAGHNVLLSSIQGGFQLYRVQRYEPLFHSHVLVVDINLTAGVPAALAAGTAGVPYDTTPLLRMTLGQLAQVRMRVLDDINVQIREQGIPTNQTQQVITQFNAFNALEDPCDHLSEKFIWEDYVLFLTPTNPTRYAAARTRVAFYGIRYVMEGSSTEQGHLRPIATFPNLETAMDSKYKFMVLPIGGFA